MRSFSIRDMNGNPDITGIINFFKLYKLNDDDIRDYLSFLIDVVAKKNKEENKEEEKGNTKDNEEGDEWK